MTDYRVRFIPAYQIEHDRPVTAVPGIIRRNLPRARKALAAIQRDREAWIEYRTVPGAPWQRLE